VTHTGSAGVTVIDIPTLTVAMTFNDASLQRARREEDLHRRARIPGATQAIPPAAPRLKTA